MSVAAVPELNKLGKTGLSVGSTFRVFRGAFERLSCLDTILTLSHSCLNQERGR